MIKISSVLKRLVIAGLVAFIAASAGPAARAQDQAIRPTAADDAAARDATRVSLHSTPPHTLTARARGREATSNPRPAAAQPFGGNRVQNPGDLDFQGGAVVDQAQSHAVYVLNLAVHCTTPRCWGDPEGFLRDLAGSEFIHITDQYVDRHHNNRYTVGGNAMVSFTLPSVPLTDSNIQAVVHAAAFRTGQTGYNHIYHVFLPPGTDECFDNTFTQCYSPDKPASFAFCAYHSSVDFTDIGHVLYSVEPFQNVAGCNDAPGSPNGQLADSTNDTLSHELFETITDPDGDGWFNSASGALFGNEIGDECVFLLFTTGGVFGNPPAFKIDGKRYAVQTEYNNSSHACTVEP
jgi:hypothetical protein